MTEKIEENSQPANLQINDLLKILEILNVVSQRGAFRPDEFSIVGGVYERIFAFLDSSGVLKNMESQLAQESEIKSEQSE